MARGLAHRPVRRPEAAVRGCAHRRAEHDQPDHGMQRAEDGSVEADAPEDVLHDHQDKQGHPRLHGLAAAYEGEEQQREDAADDNDRGPPDGGPRVQRCLWSVR
jgi:hypothetical protein